jgi:hypothetical protein
MKQAELTKNPTVITVPQYERGELTKNPTVMTLPQYEAGRTDKEPNSDDCAPV